MTDTANGMGASPTTVAGQSINSERMQELVRSMFDAPGPYEWPDASALGPDYAPSHAAARLILDLVRARAGWSAAQRMAAGWHAPADGAAREIFEAQRALAMWVASYDVCSWPAEFVAGAFDTSVGAVDGRLRLVAEAAGCASLRDGLQDVMDALASAAG